MCRHKKLSLNLQHRVLPSAALILFMVLSAAAFGGCTNKSGPKTLAPQKGTIEPEKIEDARKTLATAVNKTVKEGRKFWFQGWVSSKVQKRKTTSMFNQGTFDRNKGFQIEASLLQQKYTYYRWENRVYIAENQRWRRAADNEVPPDPFSGFDRLVEAADSMVRLPDEKIMGRDCTVLQVELSGEDIAKIAPQSIKIPEDKESRAQLAKARMTFTIWISKDENFIYQYKAILTIPVPGAGAMSQETFFKFWDYNSPSVQLITPDQVEKWIK